MKKGLLVDYQWCTGCHSCELACQMEYQLPVGQYGIKICAVGPWQYGGAGEGENPGTGSPGGEGAGGTGNPGDTGNPDEKWQYSYFPILTDQCTLCGARSAKGKLPSCVKHCQSQCIKLVSVEEANAAIAAKPKQLFMTL